MGFRFFYSETDQVFVHPAVLVFLSPEREVMRYLYGLPAPGDVDLALIDGDRDQELKGAVSKALIALMVSVTKVKSRLILTMSL